MMKRSADDVDTPPRAHASDSQGDATGTKREPPTRQRMVDLVERLMTRTGPDGVAKVRCKAAAGEGFCIRGINIDASVLLEALAKLPDAGKPREETVASGKVKEAAEATKAPSIRDLETAKVRGRTANVQHAPETSKACERNALASFNGDEKASLKGYRHFVQQHRLEIWNSLPADSKGDVCKVAGERWRALTVQEKIHYISNMNSVSCSSKRWKFMSSEEKQIARQEGRYDMPVLGSRDRLGTADSDSDDMPLSEISRLRFRQEGRCDMPVLRSRDPPGMPFDELQTADSDSDDMPLSEISQLRPCG